jgi:hypothetical protein
MCFDLGTYAVLVSAWDDRGCQLGTIQEVFDALTPLVTGLWFQISCRQLGDGVRVEGVMPHLACHWVYAQKGLEGDGILTSQC